MGEAERDFTLLGGLQAGDPGERFELDIVLDKGTSGQVWRAKDCITDNEVAIKIITKDYEDFEGVVRETQFLASFNSFYITKYVGSWVTEKTLWLVMELADLGSMEMVAQVYKFEAQFSEDELSIVCASALLGLKYLHGYGIIHRDVKGKNILVNKYGDVKLADLGIAKKMKDKNTLETELAGSPHWLAPEVASGLGYNTKVDIWAVGITLLELAEGQPPHTDLGPLEVLEAIASAPTPTLSNPEQWSDGMKEFLGMCLEKDPDVRPPARELLEHDWVSIPLRKTLMLESQAMFNISHRIYDLIEDWRSDDFKKMLKPAEKEIYDPIVAAEFIRNAEPKLKEQRAVSLAVIQKAKAAEEQAAEEKKKAKKKQQAKRVQREDSDGFGDRNSTQSFDSDLTSNAHRTRDGEESEAESFDDALASRNSQARSLSMHKSVISDTGSVQAVERHESSVDSRREKQRRIMERNARVRDQLRREEAGGDARQAYLEAAEELKSRRDLLSKRLMELGGVKNKARNENVRAKEENAKAFRKFFKLQDKKKKKKG